MTEAHLGSTGKRAFFVVALQLWNSLPREACLALSLVAFKSTNEDRAMQAGFLSLLVF